MPDLYFFREQEEIEKDEMALLEKEKETEAQQTFQPEWGGETVSCYVTTILSINHTGWFHVLQPF